MADEQPTTPGVNKAKRKFAPTIRGRGRPGAAQSSRAGSEQSQPESSGDAETKPPPSPSKPIGHLRPETSQEGRLPSVHDGQKTRGGAIKMKFKPTIPTRRNKKEPSTSAIDDALRKPESSERGGRGGGGRGRGRGGRGRGRGRGDIASEMTASGFFSLGPSAMSSRARSTMGGGGGYAMFGGDVTSRTEEDNSGTDMLHVFGDAPNDYTPVVFPHISRTAGELDPSDMTRKREKIPWLTVKSEPDKQLEISELKQEGELPVKVEQGEETTAMDVDQEQQQTPQVESEPSTEEPQRPPPMMDEDAPAQNIFALDEHNRVVSVADDEFLFFQLPSILPRFEKPETDENRDEHEHEHEREHEHEPEPMVEVKVENEESTKAKVKEKDFPPPAKKATLEEALAAMDLKDMPEGQIGSLVIYKSGKMKLKLGDTLLDIQQGMRSSFLEDVAIVDAESDESRKIIELGHIVQKFVCVPDMDALLAGEE